MLPVISGRYENAHCAEWYTGPQINVTPSVGIDNMPLRPALIISSISIGGGPRLAPALRTPFGRPVVPDV